MARNRFITRKDEKDIQKDIIYYCVKNEKFKELHHLGKLKRKELMKWWIKFSEDRYSAVCLFTLEHYIEEFLKYYEDSLKLKTPEQKLMFAIFGDKKNEQN